MKRLMFFTVGTGPDVASSILHSIEEFNPSEIVFFTTRRSREESFEQIQHELHREPGDIHEEMLGQTDSVETVDFQKTVEDGRYEGLTYHIPVTPDLEKANDAEQLHLAYRRHMLSAVGRLDIGFDATRADFTRGTKPMSSALFSAAYSLGIPRINYVTGQRDDQGMVKTGTEESHLVYGRHLQAVEALREATELFNDGDYVAASTRARQFVDNPESQLPFNGRAFRLITLAADALAAWDRFRFEEALDGFSRLKADVDNGFIGQHLFNKKQRGWTMYHLSQARDSTDGEETYLGLVADLLNNADRKMQREAWDDAMGRLYRAVEYLAQHRIKEEFGYATAEFPVDALPETLADEIEADGDTCELGSRKAWSFLRLKGDELGERYDELAQQDLLTALHQRNHSLLAHGFQPVDEKYVHILRDAVDELARCGWGESEWERMMNSCQFPRLSGLEI